MATAYMRGVNWASCLKFCPEENVRVIRLIFFGNEFNESNVSASTLFFPFHGNYIPLCFQF